MSEEFGTNFFGIFSSTTTIKETQTFTWRHTSLNSLTTTAISDGLTIAGVAYSGPTEFIYYQDNLFGTFAFPPSEFWELSPQRELLSTTYIETKGGEPKLSAFLYFLNM